MYIEVYEVAKLKVNIWEEELGARETYFTVFEYDKEYEFTLFDFNNPEELSINGSKEDNRKYYLFMINPSKDYVVSNLYKDAKVKQFFPKKSFRVALRQYYDKDQKTIRELQKARHKNVDVLMKIKRGRKSMTIMGIEIL